MPEIKVSYGFRLGKTKLSLKEAIKRTLIANTSKDSPISRNNLLKRLDLPQSADRAMRLIISELRHEGFPILFSTSKPSGYYLPANLAELKEGINKLRSYVIDECIVIRDLKVKGQQWINREGQGHLL